MIFLFEKKVRKHSKGGQAYQINLELPTCGNVEVADHLALPAVHLRKATILYEKIAEIAWLATQF